MPKFSFWDDIKFFSTFFIVLAGFLFVYDFTMMSLLVWRSKHYLADSKVFSRHLEHPKGKILFLGDSTAFGIGATSPELTIAGRFGEDFPEATIVNMGSNGKKLHQLVSEVERGNMSRFDLLIIQIGGNDILFLTPMETVEPNLRSLIASAKKISDKIIISHTGNVGLAPLFPVYLAPILTSRSRDFRDIYSRVAEDLGVIYVNLFVERREDLHLKNPKNFYSKDFLHPSDTGYAFWYDKIRDSMVRAGWIEL